MRLKASTQSAMTLACKGSSRFSKLKSQSFFTDGVEAIFIFTCWADEKPVDREECGKK